MTAAGHQVTVPNEANQVCVTPGSGVYINSRFYALSEQQKYAVVPFRKVETFAQAVITDGDVVECVKFKQTTESYELVCGFIMMEESLQMGSTASFAIKPKIFVSGVSGPIELMKEVVVRVKIIDTEGINSEKAFLQPQLSSEGLIQLDFEVPAKATNVTLQLTCQVTPMTSSDPVVLTAHRTFQINQKHAA